MHAEITVIRGLTDAAACAEDGLVADANVGVNDICVAADANSVCAVACADVCADICAAAGAAGAVDLAVGDGAFGDSSLRVDESPI
jgi:hypothetical protein